MTELLEGYSVVVEIPVQWGDMDAMQHVNNTVYFRYFETARIAYFKALGVFEALNQGHIGPILGSIECKFKVPVTYPDTVFAAARALEIQEDRFVVMHRVVSQKWGRVAAEGAGVVVSYDYKKQQKATIPAEMRQRILEIDPDVKV
ncbi:MAG: thioesterase family protein [Chloroflexota bacterium]